MFSSNGRILTVLMGKLSLLADNTDSHSRKRPLGTEKAAAACPGCNQPWPITKGYGQQRKMRRRYHAPSFCRPLPFHSLRFSVISTTSCSLQIFAMEVPKMRVYTILPALLAGAAARIIGIAAPIQIAPGSEFSSHFDHRKLHSIRPRCLCGFRFVTNCLSADTGYLHLISLHWRGYLHAASQ